MKSFFNVKKHFALFSLLVLGLTMPNAAWAYLASCPHEKYIDETNGICTNCGAGVIIFYTQGASKPNFVGYPANAFGEGSSFVKCIEIGNGNPKKIAIIFTAPVTIIPAGMYWDSDKLYSIVLPNTVKTIQSNAFNDCKWLSSVTIGSSVETIGTNAFSDCDNLTSVVLPESVTNIGYGAFFDCDGLEKIVIPEKVETIGSNAFANCDKLTTVVVEGADTQIKNDSFTGSNKIENVSGTIEQVEKIGGVSGDNADKPVGPSTPSGPTIKKWETPVLTDKGYLEVKKSYPDMTIKFDTYLRSDIANAWGTLCVPFEVSKIEDVVKFYQLKSVDFETGAFVFSEVPTVDAGVPCVFQKMTSETSLEFTPSAPVELSGQVKAPTLELSDGWSIIGTYMPLNISVKEGGNAEGQNIFYIARNQFLSINGSVNINPFRAYFKYDGIIPSSAASARFTLETADMYETGLNTQFVNEQEDGALFDLLGNRVDQMVKGRIYILNGKKVMFK